MPLRENERRIGKHLAVNRLGFRFREHLHGRRETCPIDVEDLAIGSTPAFFVAFVGLYPYTRMVADANSALRNNQTNGVFHAYHVFSGRKDAGDDAQRRNFGLFRAAPSLGRPKRRRAILDRV